MKPQELIVGMFIFWRWKGSKYGYNKDMIQDKNGDMITLAEDKYSSPSKAWIDIKDIDIVEVL